MSNKASRYYFSSINKNWKREKPGKGLHRDWFSDSMQKWKWKKSE